MGWKSNVSRWNPPSTLLLLSRPSTILYQRLATSPPLKLQQKEQTDPTMAAPVLQSVDPAHPSLETQPGPSRTATVADESEEIAAEAGVAVSNGNDGASVDNGKEQNDQQSEEAQFQAGGEGGQVEEEDVDPDAIPAHACETLYIQNLNEKVQLQGESCSGHCV